MKKPNNYMRPHGYYKKIKLMIKYLTPVYCNSNNWLKHHGIPMNRCVSKPKYKRSHKRF